MAKRMRILEVRWIDSENASGWEHANSAKERGPCSVISAGIEVKSEKDRITLAVAYDKRNNNFCQVQIIPRKSVLRVKTIGEIKFND